jgi:hypothetical protein
VHPARTSVPASAKLMIAAIPLRIKRTSMFQ